MTNIEHLIENGLHIINDYNYEEWIDIMHTDPNWKNMEPNEVLNLDTLWQICRYVKYTYTKIGSWQNDGGLCPTYCTCCGTTMSQFEMNYCAHCGAKMEEN